MASDSDDDYERVSDFELSDSEDENDYDPKHDTPVTTPQTPRSLRPSELKTISCPYNNCFKTFNRKARLNEHLRSHTNTRIFNCPHPPCTKDFLRDSHLKRHIKSAHTDIRDYTCSWEGCEKSFSTGTRLRRHEAAHEGKEKYRCRGFEGCNEVFRKHDTLRRHIVSVHEKTPPFPCVMTDWKTGKQCAQRFETAEKLRAHQRAKHDNTRFSCTICLEEQGLEDTATDGLDVVGKLLQLSSAYFATYADLQSHMITAHPPTCNFCATSFATAKELTRHLELQHGIINPNVPVVQKYTCTYSDCARKFTKKGNLNVHIKTMHENRRDFVCGQIDIALPQGTGPVSQTLIYGCGRDFTSKASLEEHIRTAHLGLGSRRMEREKKRKAEKTEAEGTDETAMKKRKPRKDKGVKKVSALTSLLASRLAEISPIDNEQLTPQDVEEDPEHDQDLTGSVTMYGSQLYRPEYAFPNSTGTSTMPPHLKTEDQDKNMFHARSSDNEDDFIFEGFEQDALPIDPLLVQY